MEVRPGQGGQQNCAKCRTLTCRGVTAFRVTKHAARCQRTWIGALARARANLRSYRPNDQTFVCSNCHGLEVFLSGLPKWERRLNEIRRAQGMRPWPRVTSWPQAFSLRSELSSLDPNWQSKAVGPGEQVPNSNQPGKSELGRRRSKSVWQGDPKVTVDRCRWCHRLTLDASASGSPRRFHQACRELALQTPEGKKWTSRRLQLVRSGQLDSAEIDRRLGTDPPLPIDRWLDAEPDPEVLRRNFIWTMRHVLGGEKALVLARQSGVAVSTVTRAVAATMDDLPDPRVASRRLAKYTAALLAATTAGAAS